MQRAYVDRRVDDLARAGPAASRAAANWGLPEPVLLRHGMNAIYRSDDVVLRVASPTAPAECSLELAAVLVDAGIPVVPPVRPDVVRTDGLSITAWRFVESTGQSIDWPVVGRAVRRVHDLASDDLPEGLPCPSPAAFPWWHFEARLASVQDSIDDAALHGMRTTLARHASWDDFAHDVICHGDVHPGNVIMSATGPLLIDWDLLCRAPTGWDHGPLMTWTERWGGSPGIYEAFAEGYGRSARGNPAAEAFAELRLLAATLMRVEAARKDPAARAEADARLRYWRGEPDAPAWRAQ